MSTLLSDLIEDSINMSPLQDYSPGTTTAKVIDIAESEVGRDDGPVGLSPVLRSTSINRNPEQNAELDHAL